MSKIIDIIVIGQGLAGSLLTWNLMQRGINVLVIDNQTPNSASRISAGLINPISGKRLIKPENFNQHYQFLLQTVAQLEKQFKQPLFYPKKILRVLRNPLEHDCFVQRCNDEQYAANIGEYVQAGVYNNIRLPFGGFFQLQTGYLDTATLLIEMLQFFASQNTYAHLDIDYTKLSLDGLVSLAPQFQAKRIIFCDGIGSMHNPYLSWLPFQPSKGEILTLQSFNKLPDYIVNAGQWLLPIGNNRYKFGATYSNDLSEQTPTVNARDQLCKQFEAMFDSQLDYEIIAHQSGVRPNTLDKQPFIGFHPQQHKLAIFNGFGSKGALTIPWYANHFADCLTKDTTLEPDVNINRYLA